MIKSTVKWLFKPGFFNGNPLKPNQDIHRQFEKIKKENDDVAGKRQERFDSVNAKQAEALFKEEIKMYNVSPDMMELRYHQSLLFGLVSLVIALVIISVPIIGLYKPINIHIPFISLFMPVFTFAVLLIVVPLSMLFTLITLSFWYQAKMIRTRQKFPFTQYLKSGRYWPSRTSIFR